MNDLKGQFTPGSYKFAGSFYSTPTCQFKIGSSYPSLGGWSCVGTKGAGDGATATVRFTSKIKKVDGVPVCYDD